MKNVIIILFLLYIFTYILYILRIFIYIIYAVGKENFQNIGNNKNKIYLQGFIDIRYKNITNCNINININIKKNFPSRLKN